MPPELVSNVLEKVYCLGLKRDIISNYIKTLAVSEPGARGEIGEEILLIEAYSHLLLRCGEPPICTASQLNSQLEHEHHPISAI